MQCPIDGTQLVMTERAGVEIDYCPQCRGVWLDRGELDKIVERSAPAAAPMGAGDRDRGFDEDDYDRAKGRKKRRGGFLEELFDF
ncbi:MULTISPECIES: zf-TFIIB domain-containing protein [unclassified Rhodosalinus]|uniref:TFIIB-type zinc ribbon-containing protein n=1 Tax=unclassified Rhodosalinus TaxID=2630183 RepID=UPI0035235CB0